MNTINNPLKINKYNDDRIGHYWVRDMGSARDYSGLYVSKELAEEMLEALRDYRDFLITGVSSISSEEICDLIKKVKG